MGSEEGIGVGESVGKDEGVGVGSVEGQREGKTEEERGE